MLRVTSGRAKSPGGFLKISPLAREKRWRAFTDVTGSKWERRAASRLISEHKPPKRTPERSTAGKARGRVLERVSATVRSRTLRFYHSRASEFSTTTTADSGA